MSEPNENTQPGTIIEIGEIEEFKNDFKKRNLVIRTTDNYPQEIQFELVKERAELTNPFSVGDSVDVYFNIRGNEYNGKRYVKLRAWRLQRLSGIAEHAATETPSPLAQVRRLIAESGLPERAFDQAVMSAYGGKIATVAGLSGAHLEQYSQPHNFAKLMDKAHDFAPKSGEPDLGDDEIPF